MAAVPASKRKRTILHVDMDAFFASVEQHDDPSLRGKPVIVGGPSKRGVVCAASYEARPFGVRSAMPMAEALRRCPNAVVRPPSRTRYGEVSGQVFAVFHRFTPLVEGLSLDEAFLDVTRSQALFGDGQRIAERIKAAIRAETGLTASAGIAPCKFAAKIASDLRKPNGLVHVPDDVRAFLAPLPVERMWGIGKVAADHMRKAGFRTIGDLARQQSKVLESLLGSWGTQVHALANGRDDRDVIPCAAAKSIGAEETFEHDLRSREELLRHLLSQSGRVAGRLYNKGLYARTVTVKIKLADFKVHTRRMTLPEPVCDTDSIFSAARTLLDRQKLTGRAVRLCGVSASDLKSRIEQPTLFADRVRERREQIEAVTAAIHKRFGGHSLTRATLLEESQESSDP